MCVGKNDDKLDRLLYHRHMHLMDWTVLALTGFALFVFLLPGVRKNSFWRATVTPLASIIGSGFLVVAPLLGQVAGSWAPAAMILILVVAYAVGGVIRFNILNSEPLEESADGPPLLHTAARVSNLALSVAYVISIAFYIRLLASFVLSLTPLKTGFYEDWLATAILVLIALIGWTRGLRGLESAETVSVSVKLSIIAALLVALFSHNVQTATWTANLVADDVDMATRLRMLAGLLLVVQGFETSRYIGEEYSAKTRYRSMAVAQIASAVIYIAFVALVVPILVYLPAGRPDETAIVQLTAHVTWILPFLLVFAAFMSQLSAAIADTLGAGGLVSQETDQRVSSRNSYPLLIAFSIALIWAFDIFHVISIASRAFAFYYMVQAIIAIMVAGRTLTGPQRLILQLWYGALAVLLAMIVLFALPAE